MPGDMSPLHELTLIGAACLGRAARRTANLVTRAYNHRLGPLGIERSTLARNLDRLIAAGLVVAAPGDGRRVLHRLTEEGETALVEALPLWRAAQDDLLARLPGEREAAIHEDLRLLRRAARGALSAQG